MNFMIAVTNFSIVNAFIQLCQPRCEVEAIYGETSVSTFYVKIVYHAPRNFVIIDAILFKILVQVQLLEINILQ